MKKLTLLLLSVFAMTAMAQVTTIPAIIQKGYTGKVTIIFNPNEGNKGMVGATKCYAHTGLITSESKTDGDWKNTVEEWRKNTSKTQLTRDGDNWKLVIPSIQSYYNCSATTDVQKLAFVFHDGPSPNENKEGKTADGKDIFVTLADDGLATKLVSSVPELTTQGTQVTLSCHATMSATMTLSLNGTELKTFTGTEFTYTHTLDYGQNDFKLVTTDGTKTLTDSLSTYTAMTPIKADRPAGIVNGIYYDENDDTKVTLCTYAASKPASAGARDITVKAKLPAHWTKIITAYIWVEGGASRSDTLTAVDGWYTVTEHCEQLNVIFRNGTDWDGNKNQTVDIVLTGNAVIEVTQSGDAKAGYTVIEQETEKLDAAQHVFVVGDFNDWSISNEYQLKQATDSAYFWIEIDGLTPQEEYAMQYVVVRADGQVKRISDLFSEKVLHQDDKYEPKAVYPSLKSYPAKGDGYVTVIQTAKPTYKWSEATLNFKRPDKNNLVIYELWVYDYTPIRTLNAVAERMDYLTSLGVNAIELMPLAEFDGNYNWGYSPNHYFAFDKAYGTPDDLKKFVDLCHEHGIAVIVDMVFNHATGLNPMNKLVDLASNPWFNVKPPHGDNVYEDWNHDFQPTKNMFTRALQYWLKEYKVDGFRMDLSHGLCGKTNNAMTHIADYYNHGVKAVEEDAYFILEHWGDNCDNDRRELIKQGMLCWDNTSGAYHATAKGSTSASFANANRQGYVSYCESHDEERMQYIARKEGLGDLKTNEDARISRVAVNVVFNVLLAGPHMIWQYEELGYDFSINSSIDTPDAYNTDNRCAKKPRPEKYWYFTHPTRLDQYTKIAQAIRLRTQLLSNEFVKLGKPTSTSIYSGELRKIQWGDQVFVAGNFSVSAKQMVTIPDGTWYNYYAQKQQKDSSIELAPGEFIILTGKQIALPEISTDFEFRTDVENVVMPSTPSEILPPFNVTIYTVGGQVVSTQYNVDQANIQSLKSGLYLIQYEKNGQRMTRKFIR